MALWSVSSALVQRRTTSGLFFTACCVAAVHCSSIIGVGNYCADWTDSVTHACVTCNEQQQQQQRCIAPSAYGSAYACSRFAPLAGSASPVGVHISPILHYTANCGLWCADQSSRNTRATFLFSGVPHDGVLPCRRYVAGACVRSLAFLQADWWATPSEGNCAISKCEQWHDFHALSSYTVVWKLTTQNWIYGPPQAYEWGPFTATVVRIGAERYGIWICAYSVNGY